MKKLLFGIFAHPDDEAFGPSAYLHDQAKNGTDVHLILATDGEAGTNIEGHPNLGEVRLQEWEESRRKIGATSGFALHYPDGGLCNDLYLEIADKIISHIHIVCTQYNGPISVEFLTFDHGGISGHLDHIAISFITTFAYLKLRGSPPENATIKTLKYYNLSKALSPTPSTGWIYMPAGKEADQYDEVFDYSSLVDKKLEIMQVHYTQRQDMEAILAQQKSMNPDCYCDHFRYFED